MTVSNGVLISIPAPVAKIEAPHECRPAIYNTQLFVMSPVTRGISGKLQITQWRSHRSCSKLAKKAFPTSFADQRGVHSWAGNLPIENDILIHTINSLESIHRQRRGLFCRKRHILQRRHE